MSSSTPSESFVSDMATQYHSDSVNDASGVSKTKNHILGMAVEDLSLGTSFISQGGHSLLAIELSSRCRSSGIRISVGAILLSQSLQEILNKVTVSQDTTSTIEAVGNEVLSADSAYPSEFEKSMIIETAVEVDSDSSSESDYVGKEVALTEMQLSFVHSFIKNPGTNVISFYETYHTANIPSVRAAWKSVIEAEPIFKLSFAAVTAGKVLELPRALFTWTESVVENRAEYEAALERVVFPQAMEISFDVVTLLGEGISTVSWRVHHVFVDGMAAQLVYKKFQGALAGKEVIAGTPFQDVIQELREYQRVTLTDRKEFWAMQAAEHPQAICDIGLGAAPAEMLEGMDSVSIAVPSESISAKTRELEISEPSWYQAAWALVLSLYTASDSVVFGSVLSGRDLPINGATDTIGPLINTLPFNVKLSQSANAADYLRSIFRHSVELNTMQCSVPEDGFTRQLTTALAMEFEMAPADDHGIQTIGSSWFKTLPDIPLSIYVTYNGQIRICFQKKRYLRGDIQVLAEHFHAAIMGLCSWTCTVGDIMASLLTTSSKDKLMAFASITEDLVTLFERASRENPTAIAVEKSRRALSRLTNEYGVTSGDVVCVHADRSLNWIVAIFAILKVGAVYSPQDTSLPPQIRETNFQTAGAKLFVIPSVTQKHIKPDSCARTAEATAMKHRATSRPSDNAYLCFTSGSTGKPKGVITPEVRFFAGPGQRISQLMSPAFDGSIHEIFSALSYGATLKANAAILTPSIAKILEPSDYPNLTTVYCVGEPMPQYVNDAWSEDGNRRLYNIIQRLHPGKKVTIGKPNPTMRVYILGRNQHFLPPGVVGEIYCAGLTAERFLPDTICGRDSELIDGEIKLRGYRLDLNDLEIRIAQAVEGGTAVAICANGDYLVCMVQPETLDVEAVREVGRKAIPAYAMPRYILPVERFPLTSAGKVDYKEIARKQRPMSPPQADIEINAASNFMALGGHSIHGISNSLPLIIRSPTLADMATAIDDRKIMPLGNDRASPIEQDWFLKYELSLKGTSSFNVSYACAINPVQVDTERLVEAWNVVLARHRIFRSRFVPCPEAKGGIHRLVTSRKFSLWWEVNRPFRLDCDENLIRVLVSNTKMLVTVLKELALRTYEQTEWWKTNLEGASRDYGIPDMQLERTSYGGKTRYTKLSPKFSHRLIRYTEEKAITLHQLALASVAMAMQLHRNDTDIVLGAPYLNRGAEDMDTVGLFLEPLPIRIKYDHISAGNDAEDFMAVVQEASQHAVSRAIPWHRILEAMGADKDKTKLYPNHPLFDIMVTFHDHRANVMNNGMLIQGLEPIITYAKGSKFLLLVEFNAAADGVILLRMEYDNECIPEREITRVQQLTIEAMSMIMDGCDYSETKQGLRSVPYQQDTDHVERKESCNFFGKRLDSLANL
ncbi:BcNRPS1, nonribosomal peptide synthetase [Xylaria sp. FL1042]|nr:BcNRPS1, nonribosomal peptide synthetase [Xylaria sp. FL1042]